DLAEPLVGGPVDRVEHGRSVDGDPGDVVGDLEPDLVPGLGAGLGGAAHRSTFFSTSAATSSAAYPCSVSTSALCSPSRGGTRRTCAGVADSRIGASRAFTRPATGCCISRIM